MVVAGVSETSMPKIRVAGGVETVVVGETGARAKGVEVAGAVTSEQNPAGTQILDTKTKGVKFNGNIIVASKSTNG